MSSRTRANNTTRDIFYLKIHIFSQKKITDIHTNSTLYPILQIIVFVKLIPSKKKDEDTNFHCVQIKLKKYL